MIWCHLISLANVAAKPVSNLALLTHTSCFFIFNPAFFTVLAVLVTWTGTSFTGSVAGWDKRKLRSELCWEIPRQVWAHKFSKKTLFRIHWTLSYLSSLTLPFTRLNLDFMEISFTKNAALSYKKKQPNKKPKPATPTPKYPKKPNITITVICTTWNSAREF